MNPVHITVLLAIAGGLGIIAYRTPLIYQKLYYPLFGVTMLTQLIFFTWTLCRSEVYDKLSPFISPDQFKQAHEAYSLTGISGTAYLIALGFIVYVAFLMWLTTQVIKHGYDKKPEQKL